VYIFSRAGVDDAVGRTAVIALDRLIGERIRLSRMLAEITREELAQRLGDCGLVGVRFHPPVKPSDVEAWERGNGLTAPLVAALTKALGVPLSFLVTNCHDES
jgi:transcriptional regulator with XRE-family HTH domain